MGTTLGDLPEWERLLAAERHLQHLVPAAVLVGGTAAALHGQHRISLDGDHVLADLRDRFEEVLTALEAAAGWTTEGIARPVLILGSLDGVLTGIRQLRRVRPLETELVAGLMVPTLAEMARIKAWLLVTPHTVRDYLDTVVLLERLGERAAMDALRPFDEIYPQDRGVSALAELGERLAAATPSDTAEVNLASYREVQPPWNDWQHIAAVGRQWSILVARLTLGGAAMSTEALAAFRALWNRNALALSSDEILAQLLDRGEIEAWRELYRLAANDPDLRRRIHSVVLSVPVAFPHLWLAALASLGEQVDLAAPVPPYCLEAEL